MTRIRRIPKSATPPHSDPSTDPVLAADGYPSAIELRRIQTWPINDMPDVRTLLAYLHPRWRYAAQGYWKQSGLTYHLSTAGWSGNEDMIAALEGNAVFWILAWFSSQRGGHHIFKAPPTDEARTRAAARTAAKAGRP